VLCGTGRVAKTQNVLCVACRIQQDWAWKLARDAGSLVGDRRGSSSPAGCR